MISNMELRKLPASFLAPIAEILEIEDDWIKVMNLIPRDLTSTKFEQKYNIEHVRLIKTHAQATQQKCAKVLFDEWGSSGRVRPTGETLLNLLVKAEMIRAADNLAEKLGVDKPKRPHGPAEDIPSDITFILNQDSCDISSENFKKGAYASYGTLCDGSTKQVKSFNLIEFPTTKSIEYIPPTQKKSTNLIKFSEAMSEYLPECLENVRTESINNSGSMSDQSTTVSESSQFQSETHSDMSQYSSFPIPSSIHLIDEDILADTNLINFDYKELESITNNFHINRHIGGGGFGDVFVGTHSEYGNLAIKKAHNLKTINVVKMFNSEVKSHSILHHVNIVPILGYSFDGPAPCIVCEYIDGGSLQQKIAAKVLNEQERINIMIGTAEGLKYIHTTVKPSSFSQSQTSTKKAFFLHGDVKSANILLTKDCIAKLCDFGLAKEYNSTFMTKSITGTSAYMAPEKFDGTITQKGDIYSFGIVLLELLTGLQPLVEDGSDLVNIRTYVAEACQGNDITPILDPVVKNWTVAQKVYDLVKLCMKDKNDRPTMDEICNTLHNL